MAKHKFLSSRQYPRADGSVYIPTMTASDMLAELGVVGDHLPKEGMPSRIIQGIEVWGAPSEAPRNGWKSSKHRVLCKCPTCGCTVSAGRIFQHVCK